MDSSIEAGPSRLSPLRNAAFNPLPENSSVDVNMESTTFTASSSVSGPALGGEPDEAVQLLLNISSAVDVPSKQELMEVVLEETRLEEKSGPPDAQIYPYTPPDDSHDIVPSKPSTSISTLFTSNFSDATASPVQPLTPSNTAPEPPAKPKQKRKRNTTGGSTRRASTENPVHWLGEDNTLIRCICGFKEDDGFTIQCEGCGAWEHGLCFGYLDESSAPDTFFCELCKPRSVDPGKARRIQLEMRGILQDPMQDQTKHVRLPKESQKEVVDEKEHEKDKDKESQKPRSKGGKAKRARIELVETELDNPDTGKEHSPGVMGPPAVKPKRRQQGGKPRAKQTTTESMPGPSSFTEQIIPEEPEDDYFRVEPWALEYTPIKENIVRGAKARQTMRDVYRDWVDAEDEVEAHKSQAIHNPSGLPSPTDTGVLRLSPDSLFPSPDFSTLAPPVPPVSLVGSNLDSLASAVSVQAISDAPSFLPLTYAENISKHGVYTRPAIYSVFADEPIDFGSFIGEYRGEITDCATYRRDRINQYASLGTPKPHVRSIGPPINLMIDARGYGNDLRFVRSGCHPNVVLRPLIWRNTEGESSKLKFGLFASKDIAKKDELVLGWEWDDQHVVHSLRSVVQAAMLSDGSLASPVFSISTKRIAALSHKIDSVLTHIFGTFTSCACVVPGTCALAQMGQIVDPKAMQNIDEDGRKRSRVDLGELIGAVRGWRRREMEVAEAKQWKMTETSDLGLTSMSMSSRSSESQTQTEEQESDHPIEVDEGVHDETEMEPDHELNVESEPMVDVDEPMEPTAEEPEEEVKEDLATGQSIEVEGEDDIRVEDRKALAEQEGLISAPPSPMVRSPATPVKPYTHEEEVFLDTSIHSGDGSADDLSVDNDSHDIKPRPTLSPNPKSPGTVNRMSSSSSLSSAISSARPSLADDGDSGSESDATTATIPKSHFSGSEPGSASDSEADMNVSPAKRHSLGKVRKVKRVMSPVIESEQTSLHDADHLLSEEDDEEIVVKRKSGKIKQIPSSSPKVSIAKTGRVDVKKRAVAQPDWRTGKSVTSRDERKSVAAEKALRQGRKKRIVSSPATEEEEGNMDVDLEYDNSPAPSSDPVRTPVQFTKAMKVEQLEAAHQLSLGEGASATKAEDTNQTLASAEADKAGIPESNGLPSPANELSSLAPDCQGADEGSAASARVPTPPREPTPSKEPTPPPEPPKKVSLSDYLKSHKIRKESQTPLNDVTSPNVETTALAPVSVLLPAPAVTTVTGPSVSTDDIPGFGNAQPQAAPAPSVTTGITSSPVKAEPATPTMAPKLNLFEFLPSARTPVAGATATVTTPSIAAPVSASAPVVNGFAVETPKAVATPSASSSYVPRSVSGGSNDYFPTQSTTNTIPPGSVPAPSSAFVPRASTSYTPRQAVGSSAEDQWPAPPNAGGLNSNANSNSIYVPRSNGSNPHLNVNSEEIGAVIVHNSVSPRRSPVEMPPPLPVREPPPHTGSNPSVNGANNTARAPPTGPKVPPTGPRGLGGGMGLGLNTGASATSGLGGGNSGPGPRGLGEGRGGYGEGGSGRPYVPHLARGGRGWRGRGFRGAWRGSRND